MPSPQSHSLPAAVRLDAHPERPDGADLERPNVVNLADMRVAGHPPHARHVVLHRQLPVPKRLVATAANAIFMKRITNCCPALGLQVVTQARHGTFQNNFFHSYVLREII